VFLFEMLNISEQTLGDCMLKGILLTVLTVSVLPVPSTYSQQTQTTQAPDLRKAIEQVDSLAATEIAKDNIGSITIGVVSGGNLMWTKSYGYADIEKKVPATRDNVYRIASITKQFTALMLLQLVEQGKVRLSDPVEKYVPEINRVQGRFPGAPPITLVQLATHTSGLDREPNEEQLKDVLGPVSGWEKMLLAILPRTTYIHEPGTRYSYSNVGYAVLGLALSRAASKPYVEYVRERILTPLKMSHTAFALDEQSKPNVARGYLIENGKIDKETPERGHQGLGWKVPVGSLYSTVDDLARFVAFELGEENANILRRKTLEDNFERVSSAYSDLTYGYGIGFQVRRRGNLTALGHDGVVAGYQCSAWIDPKTRLGIIVLTTRQEKFLGLRALEILANANRTSDK
jgi:CubicO group peptidase (beta-lactamase class C family)